jgi:hypothetical protein
VSSESAGMTRTPVCFHASSGGAVGGGGFGTEGSAILKGMRCFYVCTRIKMRDWMEIEALSNFGWRA